jgi:Bax protein
MRKKLWLVILLVILAMIALPYKSLARKFTHKNFVEFILSKAAVINGEILQDRQRLLNLYHQFREHHPISKNDMTWLVSLAQQYQSPQTNFNQNAAWQQLIQRVDIVPNSLVVAQAINESAWGSSRFATEGNNYFGQWCYSKGCGIVPKERGKNAHFEVKKYPSALSSVRSYMLNLNSNHLYKLFRNQRHLLRLAGEPIYGLDLVNALTMYSTKRQAYVKMISEIIEHYHLAIYDVVPNTNKPKQSSDFFHWF